MLRTGITCILLLLVLSLYSQRSARFIENKGQWDSQIDFRAPTDGGYVYAGESGITLHQYEDGFFDKLHDFLQGKTEITAGESHVVKLSFVGGKLEQPRWEEDLGFRENYYKGNRRATNVRSYKRAYYNDIYDGIDLRLDSRKDGLKYEFVVHPGASANLIEVEIDHALELKIVKEELLLTTSVGVIKEAKPFAYQLDEQGRIEEVPCTYRLKDNRVTYNFPEGFDSSRMLVIDPELDFSTYVGSFADNFGFTASYDNSGHLYGGAIVFDPEYPIEGGPFQIQFGGGPVDCGITKFSPDGTELVYSTYLGGGDSEAPHSLVVNDNDELYVLGTTSSPNFPVSPNAFLNSFQGGNMITGLGFTYLNGSDIFISKLSPDGGELVGSTYIGGSGNDGLGVSESLDFNYGDISRGEIIVLENGDVCAASVTASLDFPYQNGFSDSFNGLSSGVVFRMNNDLSNMLWSSATGGMNEEAAYGLQEGPDGSIYITGGTNSGNIPGTNSGWNAQYSGNVDGYIMRISEDGTEILGATYIGTPNFDQSYFVQLDEAGDVYVITQSRGDMEVSDNVYFNPNGAQYIQKFDPGLSQLIWTTRVGSTDGQINFSPTAFLVTQCNDIYLSGWGGEINNLGSADAGGTTFGLPVTPDAFQSQTDGSDFYLMVLSAEAEELIYATYFGGSSAEHVDGGTSRFDKNGTVYQAVCAGCGGLDDFPTQPGVWSPNNPSTNCNLGVFKFRLSSVAAEADLELSSEPLCTMETVSFLNLSQDANAFTWDFGDGTTSTEENPTHSYDEPGIYQIKLLAEDAGGCLGPDSTFLEVEVLPSPVLETDLENPSICSGEDVILQVTGAESYTWSPATGLSNPNVANPVFSGNQTTTYTVVGTSACGSDELEITIEVDEIDLDVEEEVILCPGESHQFNLPENLEYSWTPTDYLDDPNIANPTTTPETDITYEVNVTTELGCESSAQFEVSLLPSEPALEGDTSYLSCNGSSVVLSVSGGETYLWSPATGLSDITSPNPVANPGQDQIYTVTSQNQCGESSLQVEVLVSSIEVDLTADTITCFETPTAVEALGADEYFWYPARYFADPNAQNTTVQLDGRTTIRVTGINEEGCTGQDEQVIQIYPRAILTAGKDKAIPFGGQTVLEAFSTLPIAWEDSPDLSCLDCSNPIASPDENTTYYAYVSSEEGCIERDSVEVIVAGSLYIPNAFTPDGDGINDIFKAKGIDITEFKMEIFNRWGELIFESNSIENGWNGSSNSNEYYSPAGAYPYRIVAKEHTGEIFEVKGYVNLIR